MAIWRTTNYHWGGGSSATSSYLPAISSHKDNAGGGGEERLQKGVGGEELVLLSGGRDGQVEQERANLNSISVSQILNPLPVPFGLPSSPWICASQIAGTDPR